MARLEVEKPPYGQVGQVEAAAAAVAETLAAPENAVQAMEASAVEAAPEGQPVVEAPAPQAVPQAPSAMPYGLPTRGILQAPAVMRRPAMDTFDQDQRVGLLWNVMAEQDASPLTRAVAKSLSGVD